MDRQTGAEQHKTDESPLMTCVVNAMVFLVLGLSMADGPIQSEDGGMAAVDPRGVGWAIRKFGRWHADFLDPTVMMVRDEVEGHFQES